MCVSHEQIMIRQVRIQDNICNFEGIVTRKTKRNGMNATTELKLIIVRNCTGVIEW